MTTEPNDGGNAFPSSGEDGGCSDFCQNLKMTAIIPSRVIEDGKIFNIVSGPWFRTEKFELKTHLDGFRDAIIIREIGEEIYVYRDAREWKYISDWKPCKICGAYFIPKSWKTRLCSDICRNEAKSRGGKKSKKGNMKTKILMLVMMFVMVLSVSAQSPCLTMAQTQAKYNQDKANATVVVNTSSQQLQTYYQQLATYWQQVHKDNQQKEKDIQQMAKDVQQVAKDAQQKATDTALAGRLAAMQLPTESYDELVNFIEVLMPLLGNCSISVKTELARIHTNRSGGGDGTNPGGHGNINGFDNPGFIISR